MQINEYLNRLEGNYLFTEIVNRTQAYQAAHPEAEVLRLGVGDITLPLPAVITDAMHRAVDDLAHAETFRGYGPEVGYEWLRRKIIDHDYAPRGIKFTLDEVFISDGAGSDLGNLSELFAPGGRVAILDPSYPAYIDTSRMAGREIVYLPCTRENGFVPAVPDEPVDIIYLCFPNNPTGTMLIREQLRPWVDYALRNKAVIIYDAAYEGFIDDPELPHSIYEVPGADRCAIEVRSYSKTAGFTAVRCGYTVVPRATGLNAMWKRRQCTKFNGASYISQRGAEAVYTTEGQAAIRANLAHYKATARLLREGLQALGYEVFGGEHAPYIWCRVPDGYTSWSYFDYLLHEAQIVCTPGAGFGVSGEGYVRFSAFSARENCEKALKRLKNLADLKK